MWQSKLTHPFNYGNQFTLFIFESCNNTILLSEVYSNDCQYILLLSLSLVKIKVKSLWILFPFDLYHIHIYWTKPIRAQSGRLVWSASKGYSLFSFYTVSVCVYVKKFSSPSSSSLFFSNSECGPWLSMHWFFLDFEVNLGKNQCIDIHCIEPHFSCIALHCIDFS